MFCRRQETSVDRARAHFAEEQHCLPHNIAVYPESLTFSEARKVIGDAFGGKTIADGSPVIQLMLKPLGLESDDRSRDRQELASFYLGFSLNDILKKGTAVGIRGGDGKLKSVVVFREYDMAAEKKRNKILSRVASFVMKTEAYFKMQSDPLGLPTFLSDKAQKIEFEDCMKKIEPFGTTIDEYHKKHGPKDTHWHVGIVASDPEVHGQGFGREIMGLLSRAADECGTKCYLETAAKNQTFYERCGYDAIKKVNIAVEGAGGGELPGVLMMRQPK